jgi:hypothetical protein
MYASHARRRITGALVGLVIAGTGVLATTSPAVAADATGKGAVAQTTKAAEPTGRVVSRLPLSIRQKPTTNSRYLGSFKPGTVIRLHCKVVGQNVDGNKLWYLLGNGRPGYVAARYVQNLSYVPYC